MELKSFLYNLKIVSYFKKYFKEISINIMEDKIDHNKFMAVKLDD